MVVATHRHKDHISGFSMSNGKGPGAVIRELHPDVVIQPWTEHPDAEADARNPPRTTGRSRARRATHAGMLLNMNEYADHVAKYGARLGNARHLKAVKDQLEFLGEDNGIANRDAVVNLMTMAKRSKYVSFGTDPGLRRLLPGVKTEVLGPPTLEQTETILRQRSTDKDQFWHIARARSAFWAKRAAVAQSPDAAFAPLFPRAVAKRMPWDVGWYRYHAQREHAETQLAIVRSLDDQMNNTSVILLFEVGGKLLLFPGDAQYENWMYALEQPGVRERLAGVDVYKVGHHGSLNATPRDLWEGFSQRSKKVSEPDRLLTLLSTKDDVHGSHDRHTEVPRESLVQALNAESALIDTRGIERTRLCAIQTIELSGANA